MIRDRLDPKTRQIRISQRTYEELVRLGTLEDSFDSVIKKLLIGAGNGLVTSLSTKSRS
jgi:predicted CopG family antitoxin